MKQELDFNDPYIVGHRSKRLSRLNENRAEHVYLHKTLDEAVAAQQHHTHPILWVLTINAVVVSVALVVLLLLVLLKP